MTTNNHQNNITINNNNYLTNSIINNSNGYCYVNNNNNNDYKRSSARSLLSSLGIGVRNDNIKKNGLKTIKNSVVFLPQKRFFLFFKFIF
jgi:hypothetical protein